MPGLRMTVLEVEVGLAGSSGIGTLSINTVSLPTASVGLVERRKISTVNGSFSLFHVGAIIFSISTSLRIL